MTQKNLFLCSMGMRRSPTAARVAGNIIKERGLDIEVAYGGIDGGVQNYGRFDQYDKIFVMEQRMVDERLKKWGVDTRKTECLHLDDIYVRDNPLLVARLDRSLRLLIDDYWLKKARDRER